MRRTFHIICEDFCPYVTRSITNWKQPINVEKKIVVTVFEQIHVHTKASIVDTFAMGMSTFYDILWKDIPTVKNYGNFFMISHVVA